MRHYRLAPQPRPQGRLVILPPETVAQMQEQLLREWIDASIPALGGMTPREAVRTPEGRQRVLDLLDYIEDQQRRYPPPPGTFSADYSAVKKTLGLE